MKNSKLHTTEDKSNEKVTSSNSKSEDEQLMEVMLYVRTTHEVEHNDNQWTREFVYSFDEAKAKINRLIAESQKHEWLVATEGLSDIYSDIRDDDYHSPEFREGYYAAVRDLLLNHKDRLEALSNNLSKGDV